MSKWAKISRGATRDDRFRLKTLRLDIKGVPPYRGAQADKAIWCDLYFYNNRLRAKVESAGYSVYPVYGSEPRYHISYRHWGQGTLHISRPHRTRTSNYRYPGYVGMRVADKTRNLIWWHGAPASVVSNILGAADDNGNIVLVPGKGNGYGTGVYVGRTYEVSYAQGAGYDSIVISIPVEQASLAKSITENWVLFPNFSVKLKVSAVVNFADKRVVYTQFVGVVHTGVPSFRPAIDERRSRSTRCAVPVKSAKRCRSHKTTVSAASLSRLEEVLTPSKATWSSRLIGLAAGLRLWLVWRTTKSYQHKWLARFLSGRGGTEIAPVGIAGEGVSNLNPFSNKTLLSGDRYDLRLIRPEAEESLFWMVGSFTVVIRSNDDGSVDYYGEDIYDFHPQAGQGVAAQRADTLSWSYSEDVTDKQSKMFRCIKRLLHDKKGRWIRKVGDKYLPSNDLWNRLGGKPFTTIVAVRVKPDGHGYEPLSDSDMQELKRLYRESLGLYKKSATV